MTACGLPDDGCNAWNDARARGAFQEGGQLATFVDEAHFTKMVDLATDLVQVAGYDKREWGNSNQARYWLGGRITTNNGHKLWLQNVALTTSTSGFCTAPRARAELDATPYGVYQTYANNNGVGNFDSRTSSQHLMLRPDVSCDSGKLQLLGNRASYARRAAATGPTCRTPSRRRRTRLAEDGATKSNVSRGERGGNGERLHMEANVAARIAASLRP